MSAAIPPNLHELPGSAAAKNAATAAGAPPALESGGAERAATLAPALAGVADTRVICAGTEAEKASDFANYFCSYAYLYHQKQMLSDGVRMAAYRDAIFAHAELFEGRAVLDVGTGSGILAVWCAQAGARVVHAVEYTSVAAHAARLAAANGVGDVVKARARRGALRRFRARRARR